MNPVVPTQIKLERIVEQFDRSWHVGQPQTIGEVLDSVEFGQLKANQREDLLAELVMTDQEYRWRELTASGDDWISTSPTSQSPDGPLVEDYLDKYSELSSEHTLIRLVANEYRVRSNWGVRPQATDFVDRFGSRISSSRLLDSIRKIDDQLSESSEHIDVRTRCPYCHRRVSTSTDFSDVICSWCEQSFSLVQPGINSDQPAWIAHFELLERIGSGSFGTVWKARDTELDRLVAVKIEHQQPGISDRHFLLEEARAAASLRHMNIVPVHEVGRTDDRTYIVSDFIEGMTLDEYLNGHVFTEAEAVEFCIWLANALHHAHEAGIVHRDLKPANVLLDANGQPHVTDFGLAKREVADVSVSLEGRLLGTPAYMSPEQARGETHQTDRRSDIYSLGVILFQLLTDTLPFSGDMQTMIRRVAEEDAPSPRQFNHNLSRDVESVCLKCLEKKQKDRYQSAADFANDLQRVSTGCPVTARPITRSLRIWRWCKRNRGLSSLAAALLASVLIGFVGISVLWLQASQEKETQQRLAFELAMEEGLQQVAKGNVGTGLLWLAHSLENNPDPNSDVDRVVRLNLALWQSQMFSLERVFRLNSKVSSAAFSPKGDVLLIGTKSGEVYIWDVHRGEMRAKKLTGHLGEVAQLAVGPTMYATYGYDDKCIRLWDRESLASFSIPQNEEVICIRFSVDNETFTTISSNGQIDIWDAGTGVSLGKAMQHQSIRLYDVAYSNALAYHPDGRTILTGGDDGTARLWDLESQEPDGKPSKHSHGLSAVCFSHDGTRFATGGGGPVTIWDTEKRARVMELRGHTGRIRSLAFDPNGTRILAEAGGAVWVWELSASAVCQRIPTDCDIVAFSADGTRVFTDSTDRTARIWNSNLKEPCTTTFQHGGAINGVDVSVDGNLLAVSGSGRITLWDTRSGELLESTDCGAESGVGFVKEDPVLLAVTRYGELRLFDFQTGPMGIPMQHDRWINCVAINPEQSRILTSCFDDFAHLWDAETCKELKRISHPDIVLAAAYNPDGSKFVTACEDGKARIWDSTTYKQIGQSMQHPSGLLDVAYAPDGTLLATAAADGTARVWDAETGDQVLRPLQHDARVRSIAFSPNGQYVATGCEDGEVRYWDLATGRPILLPKRHSGYVYDLKFLPDGRLISGCRDGTARLWEVPPQPIRGDHDQIKLRVEVLTGQTLDSDQTIHILDTEAWNARRRRLKAWMDGSAKNGSDQ